MEKWVDRNLMKFKKCEVLHLERISLRHQYMLGATQLKSRLVEKELSILVDTKLTRN